MFGLKLSVRGHQHVFQLEIPELQAFHGKIELGPEIIIMALQHLQQKLDKIDMNYHLRRCVIIIGGASE